MNKIDTGNVIVAEYNSRQKVYNICTLSWAIKNNKETARMGVGSDFIIIGAFASYDEAEEACEEMRLMQDAYEEEFGFGFGDEEDLYDW